VNRPTPTKKGTRSPATLGLRIQRSWALIGGRFVNCLLPFPSNTTNLKPVRQLRCGMKGSTLQKAIWRHDPQERPS